MKHKTLVYTVSAVALLASTGAMARHHHRPAVAVIDFTNHSSAGWFNGSVGSQLADVLSNELSSSGDFNVVERKKVNAVLAEQDFGASGRVRKGSAPRIGKITGAKYLVTGSVASYTEDTSDTGGGIHLGGFSFGGLHLGGGRSKAYVAIDLRVIDAETSEVAYSRTVEGRSSDHSVDVGAETWFGIGGDVHHKNKTPASKAVRAALIEASDYLDCVMVQRDSCIDDYKAKEQKRRKSDKDSLNLD